MNYDTAFIVCGALGKEVQAIVNVHGWDVEIVGITAQVHLFPEKLAAHVEQKIIQLQASYTNLLVIFGDCGTYGALDALLEKYDIPRLKGSHCYEFYAGKLANQLTQDIPGTFFLTDFLVRKFKATIIKGMGLDRYPQLKDTYFRNYQRIVYLTQQEDTNLLIEAHRIAAYLHLPIEQIVTGYGGLESQLIEFMQEQ